MWHLTFTPPRTAQPAEAATPSRASLCLHPQMTLWAQVHGIDYRERNEITGPVTPSRVCSFSKYFLSLCASSFSRRCRPSSQENLLQGGPWGRVGPSLSMKLLLGRGGDKTLEKNKVKKESGECLGGVATLCWGDREEA